MICWNRLYFEDKNTERYGWHVFGLQPLLSTARFYLDAVTLPARVVLRPPWTLECNAGYAKPGDAVPYRACLLP